MENESKIEITYTLEEAQKKFRSNPLLYAMILLGIIGLLFPFLGWLMQSQDIQDLDQLKSDLENVQNAYKRVYGTVEKIVSEESYRWKLSDYDRKLLKKLAQEKRNAFVEFFSFLYFLMQGCFFLLLGILLERRIFFPRRMMPKETIKKLEEKMPEKVEEKTPEVPISVSKSTPDPMPEVKIFEMAPETIEMPKIPESSPVKEEPKKDEV